MAYVSTESATQSFFGFNRKDDAIHELDGLRAIAIILVLGRHISRVLHDQNPDLMVFGGYDFATPFLNGWIGVDLFFVLSGFLISRHLIGRASRGQSLQMGPYLSARALRIVPAYLAVLFLVLAGSFPFFDRDVSTLSVLVHLLFLQDYLGANIVVAFWSLGVEEKFYIAAPLVVFAALRSEKRFIRYGLLVSLVLVPLLLRSTALANGLEAGSYAEYFPRYRSPFHLTFDGLAIGMLIAFFQADGFGARINAGARTVILWASMFVLVVLSCMEPMMDEITAFDIVLQPLLISASFGGILFAMLNRPDSSPHWLGGRYLFVIAILSYTLYLVHMPLIPLATVMATAASGGLNPLLFVFYLLALSTAVSLIIHFFVEKPFLSLKSALAAR